MNTHLQDLAARYTGKHNACDGKVAHATEAKARTEARTLNRQPRQRYKVVPYHCPFCAMWHVGREMDERELKIIATLYKKERYEPPQ